MSKATFTYGRFNPPTEIGHGKLVNAVKAHSQETGGQHYIFASHSQDAKKNPLNQSEKVSAMKKLFPKTNVVAHGKIKNVIDAVKHLEKQGHTHVTMIVGSDRVAEFSGLLNKYRKKEFPGIKKVEVKSAGHRDPDAEGAEGMSASKLRGLVSAGKKEEFVSHYSDKKLGAELHDRVKAGMQMESKLPMGIFLLGGPGSGKDYVLKNIFSRFDLTEVQVEHLLNGAANELIESSKNIVINGSLDEEKITQVKELLEGYNFDCVYVSVSNKVSRLRNSLRENPIAENKRLEKWYRVDKFAESLEEKFTFNNSLNLNESSEFEKVFFADQIQKLLERLIDNGLVMKEESEPKSFTVLREKKFPPVRKKYGMPEKYVRGLSKSTAMARKRHWEKAGKLSDKDPEAYKPAPGDKTAETKPSKHTLAVRRMMDESDSSLAAKAEKSGISVATLRKVYKRGVAAWNSGHRPGTTPQQWGHARVNSYINKGKTYHTADKDLREETDINDLFEMQLMGTDEYRKHAIAMTPGQSQEIQNAFPVDNSNKKLFDKKENKSKPTNEHSNCGTPDCCGECSGEVSTGSGKSFRELRSEAKEEKGSVDFTPTLTKRKSMKGLKAPGKSYDSTMDGLPVTTRLGGVTEAKSDKGFMPTPRQVPAPKGGHPVPAGYERVKSWGGAWELRKIREKPTTVKEAVEYHIENKISFTENVFRPGSDMFFEMIGEAKKLYKEGKYSPEDEYEKDLLESDIGEKAIFEGKEVMIDFPFEEGLNEADDPTDGKGIGKPFRQGSGAAVYVRTGDGGVRKVNFSQSGMKKRYNEPARVRSFVARHKCLTNKDKTSASYWACRWPRYFSNTGQQWW